jgi:hypothetical protein
VKKEIKWAISTLACLPGLAAILLDLWVPPGMSKILLGAVIEACGIITLLIFNRRANEFKAFDKRRLHRNSVMWVSIFIFSLISYFVIYDLKVIYSERYDEALLIPFGANEKLDIMVSKSGGLSSAINVYGPQALRDVINDDRVAFAATKVAFFANYLLIFVALTLAFAWSATRGQNNRR